MWKPGARGGIKNVQRLSKSEKGQALVEFAMVLPIYLFLLFLIINMGWIMFQYFSFDYAYREAAYEMVVIDEATGAAANESIKSAIIDKASWLDGDNLTVDNARIKVEYNEEVPYYTPMLEDGKLYTLKQLQTWVYAEITADIQYDIKFLVPFGDDFISQITVNKELIKERVERTQDNTDT